MFIGSGLIRARGLGLERLHEGDAVAGDALRPGHVEERPATRGSVVWTRWPSPGSRRFVAHAASDRTRARRLVRCDPLAVAPARGLAR